jgi:outer membrane protein assembly factor BamE (lipoprotein component of BamABCDE complex)
MAYTRRSCRTIIFAALALAALIAEASAQQRTYYDARGNSLGRSTVDSLRIPTIAAMQSD